MTRERERILHVELYNTESTALTPKAALKGIIQEDTIVDGREGVERRENSTSDQGLHNK